MCFRLLGFIIFVIGLFEILWNILWAPKLTLWGLMIFWWTRPLPSISPLIQLKNIFGTLWIFLSKIGNGVTLKLTQARNNKYVYTKFVVCRLGSARRQKHYRRTNGPTDGPTDRRTDGRTHPLIESWLTTKNKAIRKKIIFLSGSAKFSYVYILVFFCCCS